jgi:hypothetical protein
MAKPSYTINDFDNSYNTFSAIFANMMRGIDTIIPAEIINYKNNLCDVKILLQEITTNNEIIENPIIYNIPVMMLFGGGCQITFQLKADDKGLLLASKQNIQNYKDTKTATPITNTRNFKFENSFFLPVDFNSVGDGIILKNNETVINILDGEININGDIKHIGNMNITGNLEVSGDITATGDVIAGGISLKNHTHPFPYNAGSTPATGNTNPPQ